MVEFIKSDSPLAEGMEKTYTLIKETEKKKYLPSEIVSIAKEKGYSKFSISIHTKYWQSKDAKAPEKNYGVLVAKTWYWYENWLNDVLDYCCKNKEHFC